MVLIVMGYSELVNSSVLSNGLDEPSTKSVIVLITKLRANNFCSKEELFIINSYYKINVIKLSINFLVKRIILL